MSRAVLPPATISFSLNFNLLLKPSRNKLERQIEKKVDIALILLLHPSGGPGCFLSPAPPLPPQRLHPLPGAHCFRVVVIPGIPRQAPAAGQGGSPNGLNALHCCPLTCRVLLGGPRVSVF